MQRTEKTKNPKISSVMISRIPIKTTLSLKVIVFNSGKVVFDGAGFLLHLSLGGLLYEPKALLFQTVYSYNRRLQFVSYERHRYLFDFAVKTITITSG